VYQVPGVAETCKCHSLSSRTSFQHTLSSACHVCVCVYVCVCVCVCERERAFNSALIEPEQFHLQVT
jgi:hypothetical protein